jgi:putative chitinase
MAQITPVLLHNLAHGGDPALLAALAPEFESQLAPAGIDTRLRLAHFLAQACHETMFFERMEESLSYGAARLGEMFPKLAARAGELANNPEALGNAAYAGRLGNGDEASGDGFRYRGRGCFGLTFRGNYDAIGKLLGVDLVSQPDLVREPHWAVATAIAFWNARHVSEAADTDDIRHVTKLVNGGVNGMPDRMLLKHRALALLAA